MNTYVLDLQVVQQLMDSNIHLFYAYKGRNMQNLYLGNIQISVCVLYQLDIHLDNLSILGHSKKQKLIHFITSKDRKISVSVEIINNKEEI